MQCNSGFERVGARSATILTASSPVLPDAATADPDQAKTMLASARPRHAVGLRFPRGRIERGEDGQAVRVLVALVARCVEAIGRAVCSRAADDAWRHTFNTAGWQTDASILLRPSHEALPTAFPRSADG